MARASLTAMLPDSTAAVQVAGKHDGQRRADAVPFDEARLDAGQFASAQAIAAVEHEPLIDENRLQQAMGLDIFHQHAKIGALHQWKQLRRGMHAFRPRGRCGYVHDWG